MVAKVALKVHNPNKVYAWNEGARLSHLNPQACGDRLDYLVEAGGGKVLPNDVVRDARKEDSPFHAGFEWDNRTAANEWRLEQARLIIRSIRVVIVDEKGKEKQHRVHVHCYTIDEEDGNDGYVTLEKLKENPGLRQQALWTAYTLLLGIQSRYDELNELEPVFDEVKKLGKRLRKGRKRGKKPPDKDGK